MYLKNSKIIVIKIGSSLLVDSNKRIRKKWLSSFASDIKKLKNKNQKIVIVSSGAIALGCKKMNFNKKTIKLDNHFFLIFLFFSTSNDDPILITIIFEFLRDI